jgi:site-specific DNA-methyltransferase (adenine-specific)
MGVVILNQDLECAGMINTTDNAQIIQGDCLALMDDLPINSIDAIITDPPYGTTRLTWDKEFDLESWWMKVGRVIKPNGVIVTFSQQPFTTKMINSNRKHFRYEIIWKKTAPVGFLDAKIRPLRLHENILVFCEQYRGARNSLRATYNPQFMPGKPYIRKRSSSNRTRHYGAIKQVNETVNDGRRYPVDVLEFPNRGKKSYHPTQKPVPLMRWLVLTYTDPNDLVLDTFAGAGSTWVACVQTGRRFIGIERELEYVEISRARINAVMNGEEE